MTLAQIKAMFVPGSSWTCHRNGPSLTIHGNTGTVVMPRTDVTEARTVVSAKSELVWLKPDGKSKIHTAWPKAPEVIESRPGFLKFAYNNGVLCTFTQNP